RVRGVVAGARRTERVDRAVGGRRRVVAVGVPDVRIADGGREGEAGLEAGAAVAHPARLVGQPVAATAVVRRRGGGRDADGRGAGSELLEVPLVVAELARVAERIAVVG